MVGYALPALGKEAGAWFGNAKADVGKEQEANWKGQPYLETSMLSSLARLSSGTQNSVQSSTEKSQFQSPGNM